MFSSILRLFFNDADLLNPEINQILNGTALGIGLLWLGAYAYFEAQRRKRIERTEAFIDALQKEHFEGIASWRLLFHAMAETPQPEVGQPGKLEEWLARERNHAQAIFHLCEVLNRAGHLVSQKQLDLFLLRSEFGQQIDTLYEWFKGLPGCFGQSFITSRYPYFCWLREN